MTTEKKLEKRYPVFLEIIPIFLFFIGNKYFGIYVGTGILMVTSLLNLIFAYIYTKTIHVIPVITCMLAVIFGGLTIFLHDPSFIKIKVTLLNLFFAASLFVGLLFKKNFLKITLNSQLEITDYGWNLLIRYWITFFLLLAVLNEVVYRNVDTNTWVNFKVFGITILTIIFSVAQLPIINKHKITKEKDD